MSWLKTILEELLVMIDNGDFEDLTIEDFEKISTLIHRPETLGREEAAKFLGVSMSKFYELRDKGIIPQPRKVKGLKEKVYHMCDLCKALKIIQLENEKND